MGFLKFFLILILAVIIFYYLIQYFLPQYFPAIFPQGKKDYYEADIKGKVFKLKKADTDEKRREGLSGRDGLAEDAGMIFLFDSPGRYAMWMRGMRFSLDIIWLRNKQVVDKAENLRPAMELKPESYTPVADADAVIELNAGAIQKLGLEVGDKISW